MVDITAYILSHKLPQIYTTAISSKTWCNAKIYAWGMKKHTLVLPYGLCGVRGKSSVHGEFLGDP